MWYWLLFCPDKVSLCNFCCVCLFRSCFGIAAISMDVYDVRGEMENGKKRKICGTQLWKRREAEVTAQLAVTMEENVGLHRLLKQQKDLVDDKVHLLEQKKHKMKELRRQLRSRKSRVMELEAEKYFLAGDLHEKSIVETELRDKLAKTEEKVTEAKNNGKRKLWKSQHKTKLAVLKAFEWEETTANALFLRAVCAFWEVCSSSYNVEHELDHKTRMSQKDRMAVWKEITLTGWGGKLRMELEKDFMKSKRFCPMRLARESDVQSRFSVSAAREIGHCDPSRKKYERGLIPSDTTCRRVMNVVYNVAEQIGFSSFPVEENGNVWCWGDAEGLFTKGVNRYVYEVFCKIDPECEMAPQNKPWLVPLTGDLARVSFRGKSITRLPSQTLTGKTINQSSHMYTPAMAGYKDEKDMMPYFDEFVGAFETIKERGFCVVDDKKYNVNIKPVVVADMAFEHKYLERGGGSATTTCFCMFCSNTCHLRHKGYPGGCQKCRKSNCVYDAVTGVQQCKHHNVCTEDFLKGEEERFEDLTCRVCPNIPKSKLPVWESVAALRMECVMRCSTDEDRASLKKKTTAAQLEKWLLTKCRRK